MRLVHKNRCHSAKLSLRRQAKESLCGIRFVIAGLTKSDSGSIFFRPVGEEKIVRNDVFVRRAKFTLNYPQLAHRFGVLECIFIEINPAG
jgi:hypothetical protein